MTEEQLLTTMLNSTFTKADIYRRMNLLREYLEYRYFTSGTNASFEDFTIEKDLNSEDTREMNAWGSRFFDTFDKDNLYSLMESLMRKLQTLPVFTLYLPFEPNAQHTKNLIEWLRTNVHKMIILDMRRNHSLVLGCAFIWRGIYRNFSFHYFLEKHRTEVNNLLTYYATKYVPN